MEFKVGHRKLVLQGIKTGSRERGSQGTKAKQLTKILAHNIQLAMIYVTNVREVGQCHNIEIEVSQHVIHKDVETILSAFEDVFSEFIRLPPSRGDHDHRIPLLEGTNPFNQRPSRYSISQRNEIDKMVKEMLTSGIVQPSRCSFASPLHISFGKFVIVMVMDRLSKAAHFLALSHPYSAMTVAPCYWDNVFTLHGFPKTITSDRDAVFTSEFWNAIFKLQGVTLILFFSLPRPPEVSIFEP